METNHTEEDWKLKNNFHLKGMKYVPEFVIQIPNSRPATLSFPAREYCTDYDEYKRIFNEAEKNAKLIAEAGTVANECGLTPRQLLDQRNELLEAAKALLDEFKGIRINDTTAQRFEKLILLDKAIKATE